MCTDLCEGGNGYRGAQFIAIIFDSCRMDFRHLFQNNGCNRSQYNLINSKGNLFKINGVFLDC